MLAIHITFLVLGIACLFLSFVMAILFLVQNVNIKRKHFSPLVRSLPSVDRLDRWMYKLLIFGFPCMTIGVVLGVVLAHSKWSALWTNHPDVIFALVCWVWYGLLIFFRSAFGWRGRRLSMLNMIGFATVLFTLFGLEALLGEGIHSFF